MFLYSGRARVVFYFFCVKRSIFQLGILLLILFAMPIESKAEEVLWTSTEYKRSATCRDLGSSKISGKQSGNYFELIITHATGKVRRFISSINGNGNVYGEGRLKAQYFPAGYDRKKEFPAFFDGKITDNILSGHVVTGRGALQTSDSKCRIDLVLESPMKQPKLLQASSEMSNSKQDDSSGKSTTFSRATSSFLIPAELSNGSFSENSKHLKMLTGLLEAGIISNEEFHAKSKQLEKLKRNTKFDIAVVIGNSNYTKKGRDIPNVTPAYADAKAVKNYFLKDLGVKEENLIFLKDATTSQLVSVFGNYKTHKGQLYNWVKPEASNVYIYYAGHGAPAGSDGTAYLVPSDASTDNMELTGYPLDIMYKNLENLPSKSTTVILESCFSGASQSGTLISNASPIYLKEKAPNIPSNISVISAGSANEMASWEKDKSNSLFTKYFLSGIKGEADNAPYGNADGDVDALELGRYLDDPVSYYARRYYGREQNVQIVTGEKS